MFEDNYPEGLKRLLVIKGMLQSSIRINIASVYESSADCKAKHYKNC